MDNLIITIGREFGSNGRLVGGKNRRKTWNQML